MAARRSRPGTFTWSGWARRGDEVTEAADAPLRGAREAGVEVVYDDRDAGPGEKLTDAELLGCPLRLVVGRRALAEGVVEAQVAPKRRRGAPARWPRRRAGAPSCSMASTERPGGHASLFGLDRSGPKPQGDPARASRCGR